MENVSNTLRPVKSDSSLSELSLNLVTQNAVEAELSPSSIFSNTSMIPIAPLPGAPRARAETATSDELRKAYEPPVERLKRLDAQIRTTLDAFEDTRHPRLPELVYDGLRRCADEMTAMIKAFNQPHVMEEETATQTSFIRENRQT